MKAALVALEGQLQKQLAELRLAVEPADVICQLVHVPLLDAFHTGASSAGASGTE